MKTLKKFVALLFLISLFSFEGFSSPFLILDSLSLSKVKTKIQNGTAPKRTINAYKRLIKKAEKLLSIPTPSGDNHDYLSISRYWWPNPDTPNELPWIRKDGQTNPYTQTDAADRKRLGTMTRGVEQLSLAYYFSEDERFAQKKTLWNFGWKVYPSSYS